MDYQTKKIALLGSTGSIGRQALEVIRQYPDRFKAEILIAGQNVDTLIDQCREFRPKMAIIANPDLYDRLKEALHPLGIETAAGEQAVTDAMSLDCFDTLLNATVGYSGLAPTLNAIAHHKKIALANKETLVVAGEIVTEAARRNNIAIMPVDSEHSAIYQCLVGEDKNTVTELIVTASGGPFRTFSPERIAAATVKDALNHPNWSMGAKITIDSATMLNKSFEIIEARWLFDIPGERISAIVHPQSIIHSMVRFHDGAVKAQLGVPDMKLPIRYAIGEGTRLLTTDEPLDFKKFSTLTFEMPDPDRFPCVTLGHYALKRGGTAACTINAANEIAVAAFLKNRISFNDIYRTIMATLDSTTFIQSPDYHDYVAVNAEARRRASDFILSIDK